MTILRMPALRKRTGLSAQRIYQLMREKQFPRSIELGPNSVGWDETEVEEWLRARPRRRLRGDGKDLPQAGVPQG